MTDPQKHDPSSPSNASRFVLERRQFLTLGATALVGLAVTSFPAAALADVVSGGQGSGSLRIGFIGDVTGSGRASTSGGVVRAASAISPATDYSTGSARLRVRGVWRTAAARTSPLVATLLAYYPTPAGLAPFVAWTFDSSAGKASMANLSRSVINVDDGTLEMALITSSSAPRDYNTAPVDLPHVVAGSVSEVLPSHDDLATRGQTFSLGSRGSENKLAWGTYFIAFADGSTKPGNDWSGIRSADLSLPEALDVRGAGPLSYSSYTASGPVDFSYLVVTVEPQPVETYRRRAR